MSADTGFNRLKDEKSSYLLQHKDHPVHWWPYGPEAIQKAKSENKPIFLSIGYSSCHWCHVMADESFENVEVAKLLNENFICIKVDKEEHPDIDSYYQQACQLYIRTGGWPLSAFLLPDMRPYFVGTYFPLKAVNGNSSFPEILTELSRAFNEDKEQIEENASKVTDAIKNGVNFEDKIDFEGHFPSPSSVMQAISQFKDEKFGGYGAAPKFPQFAFYEWAVEQMLEGMIPKEQGDHIVKSLENMLMGGINDHARGGIHRYSVDEKWIVPHFEKMLYDQAGLLKTLAKLSLIFPSPLVYDTLINTLDYLEYEMLSEKNYFFSAQDADSEGVEGLYFTYSEQEFEDILKNDEDLINYSSELKEWFNITPQGNFDQALNVISLNLEKKQEIYSQEGWERVRKVRTLIIEDRKNRIPPKTDTKGVASWNFMVISALIDVMQFCKIDFIRNQASNLLNKALEGIYENFLPSKNLQAVKIQHSTTKDQNVPLSEDYVFFAEAQLRLYEISGNQIFKNNFIDTMKFIKKEFFKDNKFYTRAVSTNDHELYPNQDMSSFDQSFKSTLATFLGLVKRSLALCPEEELNEGLQILIEDIKQMTLRNPIASGEALRAMTYPDDVYRIVKIPKSWLNDPKYSNFISYFLPRFVVDFHDEESENWQICRKDACELTGVGLENFIQTLSPAQPEEVK